MLIDEFLPAYYVAARYQIDIHAPIEQVYAAVRTLDMSRAPLTRWLFWLRELPLLIRHYDQIEGFGLTLDELVEKSGFILLGENPPYELLMGLVGRFWTPTVGVRRMNAAEFRRFNETGYARAVMNFSLSLRTGDVVRLATETRVCCPDETSRRRFRLYWACIGPFSGLIRKDMLRIVRQELLTYRRGEGDDRQSVENGEDN